MPHDDRFAAFMQSQRDLELSLGRFSEPFGTQLLPGMYAMPQHVIDQHGKCRLITNHSFGTYSLNSLIPNNERTVKLDGVRTLATLLIALRKQHGPTAILMIFKSDVSQAYRRLPMHPLWQALQALRIDNLFYIDRNNVFGGAASGRMWTIFYAVVAWIAETRGIHDLKSYIDDIFSVQVGDKLEYYPPYNTFLPANQVRLLLLWDEIGLPHERKKQVFGIKLTVVGFDFDTVTMTVTMPAEARSDLCDAIAEFASYADLTQGKSRRSVLDFQRLIGWINWALNMYPLLRPGLMLLYEHISGKTHPYDRVYVTEAVARDLNWIRNEIRASDGVFLLEALAWDESDPSAVVVHTDASLKGIGFWVALTNEAFYADLPSDVPMDTIFFFEAFVVLCAIRWASQHPLIKRLLVYSDNYNTVNIYSSFAAKTAYYPILMEAANILMDNKIELRVVHIAGERNDIADLLSRHEFEALASRFPGLIARPFRPDPPGQAGSL